MDVHILKALVRGASAQSFWIASRTAYYSTYSTDGVTKTDVICFGLYDTDGNGYNGRIRATWQCLSNGNDTLPGVGNCIRPCIDIDLTKVNIGITGTGESASPYSITAR